MIHLSRIGLVVLVLGLSAVAWLGASVAPAAQFQFNVAPSTAQAPAKKPPAKLVCSPGRVVTLDGRVAVWDGGCSFKGKPVGTWSWSYQTITDATGTACTPLTATSGDGSSFEPKPSARLSPAFTFSVEKTSAYPAKVMRVGGKPVIVGWDSCGTPLQAISRSVVDTNPICSYDTDPSWDLATRTLRLGAVVCPASFGECKWAPEGKAVQVNGPGGFYPVSVYGGRLHCANEYTVIPYNLLGGCIRVDYTGAFVIPPTWHGWGWWDVTLLSLDAGGYPLPFNVKPPYNDPRYNGFALWKRVGNFYLVSDKPMCPLG